MFNFLHSRKSGSEICALAPQLLILPSSNLRSSVVNLLATQTLASSRGCQAREGQGQEKLLAFAKGLQSWPDTYGKVGSVGVQTGKSCECV